MLQIIYRKMLCVVGACVRTDSHTQFSCSREMLSPLTLVPLLRIFPKEIMQNVGAGRAMCTRQVSCCLI